jgi:hypothetical protein
MMNPNSNGPKAKTHAPTEGMSHRLNARYEIAPLARSTASPMKGEASDSEFDRSIPSMVMAARVEDPSGLSCEDVADTMRCEKGSYGL